VQSFAEAGRFDGFEIHAGDAQGTLTGSRLDEVASLTLKSIVFMRKICRGTPAAMSCR